MCPSPVIQLKIIRTLFSIISHPICKNVFSKTNCIGRGNNSGLKKAHWLVMQFSSFSGVRRKISIIGAFIIYAFKWNKSTCDSLLTLNDEDDRLGTKRTEVCETDILDENRVNWTQVGIGPPLILMIIEFENGMIKCSLWTETRTSALVSIVGT